MLVTCPECKKEISSNAAVCPNCGFKRAAPSNKRWLFIAAAVLIAVVAIGIIGRTMPGSSVNSELVSRLIPKRAQCRENVAQLEKTGVKLTDSQDINGGSTVAQYDETVWSAFDQDTKVQQALLIYCAKMPDDGKYTVMIQGLHNGQTLGSIVDGNYLD